jgi:hypothetical protein
MQTDGEQLPTLTLGLLVRALLFGTAIAIVLAIIDGPVWTCYLASLLAAPYVLWQLWAIDPGRKQGVENRRSAREHGADPRADDDSG